MRIEVLVAGKKYDDSPFNFRYTNPNYSTRINYYSSSNPLVKYNTYATGNVNNDNAALLIENRFAMASVGNEGLSCSAAGVVSKYYSWHRLKGLLWAMEKVIPITE
jgi:hypothetical protein